jgi:transcriptional regulator with GAF, ATPase, and Fis domain
MMPITSACPAERALDKQTLAALEIRDDQRYARVAREATEPARRLVVAIDFNPETGVSCNHDFNALLRNALARFAGCEASQFERELQQIFHQFCQFLEIERAGLWCRSQNGFTLKEQFPSPQNGRSRDKAKQTRASSGPGPHQSFSPSSESPFPWISALRSDEALLFSSLEELPEEAQQDKEALAHFGMTSGAVIPFMMNGQTAGMVSFALGGNQKKWVEGLVERLKLVTASLGNALARRFREDELLNQIEAFTTERKLAEEALCESYNEIKQLKERLQAESDYLKEEIKLNHVHGEIIGQSKAIKQALHQVEQVARASCAVLITGETGTGKELIAREIHRLSQRAERVMVLVNCAALPAALVESELFGREKGAFTGALTSQVGRFEVADGSTIFLDEIGELSLEIQAKLLRVLQEGEFQRLGNPKTHKVKVRVIAASNRDLAKEVREGRFRQDLFYRLQVFPINVPPLRERAEDIPLLTLSFVEEFSVRMGKQVNKIPRKVIETLQQHSWPGNIRELRNVIERGIILSPGQTLVLPSLNAEPKAVHLAATLKGAERDHILKTLDQTGWRIKGAFGAAKILGINPSTLYSRMEKLRIHRYAMNGVTPGRM